MYRLRPLARAGWSLALIAGVTAACDPEPNASSTDASIESAALDAEADADGSLDAEVDGSLDAEVDASLDAEVDASLDAEVDASVDAGSDAPNVGDGGGCLVPPTVISAPASYTGFVATGKPSLTQCGGYGGAIFPFTLTTPTLVSVGDAYHIFQSPWEQAMVVNGCDGNGTTVFQAPFCAAGATGVLSPGTYTWVMCGGGASTSFMRVMSSPPPPEFNDSCNTATVLSTFPSNGSIYDNGTRYYSFTRLNPNATYKLQYSGKVGRISISLRTVCGNPATEIANIGGSIGLEVCTGPLPYEVTLPPLNGTYYLVVTAPKNGVEFSLLVTP